MNTPNVDWYALSPTGAARARPRSACSPRRCAAGRAAAVQRLHRRRRVRHRGRVRRPRLPRQRERSHDREQRRDRDQLAAFAQVLIAGCGALGVGVAYAHRLSPPASRSTTRCSHGGRRDGLPGRRPNLMTLFLGLEWFSIALYILCAYDVGREGLARGRTQVPRRRRLRLGRAPLRLGVRLRRDRTSSGSREIAAAPAAGLGDDLFLLCRPRDDHRRARLQGLGRAVPHVDAGRLQGAPTPVTAFMAAATKAAALVLALRVARRPRSRSEAELWTIALAVDRLRLARRRQPGRPRADERQAAARVLVDRAGGFHAHPVAAGNEHGGTALLFYLIPYGAASLGAFAVVAARERELGRPATLETMGGMGWERPLLGVAMWVFMLSFAGLPLDRRLRREVLRLRLCLGPRLELAHRRRRHRHCRQPLLLPRGHPRACTCGRPCRWPMAARRATTARGAGHARRTVGRPSCRLRGRLGARTRLFAAVHAALIDLARDATASLNFPLLTLVRALGVQFIRRRGGLHGGLR